MSDHDTDARDESRPGIDRRTLIKRAAAVGASAWVAPTIIQSLTSPAGAVTVGACDYYVYRMDRSGNSSNCSVILADLVACPTSTPTVGSSACTSFTRRTSATTPVVISTGSGCTGGATESVTFTITTAGRFFAGQAASVGAACANPMMFASTGTQTVTITQGGIPNGGRWWAYLAVG